MDSMNRERALQEAARRYARLQAIDRQAESPEQRQASELAERVLAGVDALAQDPHWGEKLRAMANDTRDTAPVEQAPRRWRVAASLAASLALAVLCWQAFSPTSADAAYAYESAGGERRAVTLADGSRVELDIDTRIAVRMSAERREIELLSGRALFDVAHDATRPFSVTAADARTTALGTKFQVRRDDANVVVTLAEGSVAIDRVEQGAGSGEWSVRLVPGEQFSIDTETQRRERRIVDVNTITSWTHGRHIFRGTPLQVAIDEVNRYGKKKIRLGDATLASLPVAGNFIVGDSEAIVEAFAAVLPLRVVDGDDREIILFRSFSQ
jgi:transmembrane sensor